MCYQCNKLILRQFGMNENIHYKALKLTLDTLKCPAMRALEELTPSGSEYVNDVEHCYKHIRHKIDNLFDLVKKCTVKKNQLIKEMLSTNDLEMIERTCKHCHGVCVRTKMGMCIACGRFQ